VAALLQLSDEETVIILRNCQLNGVMVGEAGLNEHNPGLVASPRTTCNLGEQLEAFFGCTVMREQKGLVGIQDANDSDFGKVKPFRDHLSSDEDLSLAVAEGVQDAGMFAPAHNCVPVKPQNLHLREQSPDFRFNSFRASTFQCDHRPATLWTALLKSLPVTAVVASHRVVGCVVNKRHCTVGALSDEVAFLAHGDAGVAPSVQEQNDLLAFT
jgi:hypothetical protein